MGYQGRSPWLVSVSALIVEKTTATATVIANC
jgi:hypothetical protein